MKHKVNEAFGNVEFSTADKTSHCTMNVHQRVTQFLSKAVTTIITAPSHGENDRRRGDSRYVI